MRSQVLNGPWRPNEKSVRCRLRPFLNGEWEGTLEEGIEVCEAHIGD